MGYLIVGIMVGIDYSFMFTTLYLYLEQMIKTPNPRLVGYHKEPVINNLSEGPEDI